MSTDPREFEHPIDGTGGTVTPLADVIAGVLAEHQWYDATNELDGLRFGCACLIDDEGNETALLTETPSAHQARAVLAAISEAGTVEWGWEYQSIIGGDYGNRITRNWGLDRPLTREESQAHVDAMNKDTKRPDAARLVSRIVGPWTAVE